MQFKTLEELTEQCIEDKAGLSRQDQVWRLRARPRSGDYCAAADSTGGASGG